MTGPLEQRLEQVAKRKGWRLRWKVAPLPVHQHHLGYELDIFAGKRLVNVSGPICVIHLGGRDTSRETIADMVLRYLSRRSPPADAVRGGRA